MCSSLADNGSLPCRAGAHSMLGSFSEELASSRNQSVSSLLEGGALRPAAAGQQRR